jgi:AcrR family transcriptional regulator
MSARAAAAVTSRAEPMSPLVSSVEDGRRREILAAALTVFAEKGYDGGTMRDIARRVGVTEPALYRHFSGKEELFLTLLETVATRIREETGVLLDGLEPADVAGSLARIFADRRVAVRAYAPAMRTILIAAAHNDAFLAAFRDAIALPMRAKIMENVERVDAFYGISRPADETAARVRTLMSLAVGAMVTSLVLGDDPESTTADAFARIMGWDA